MGDVHRRHSTGRPVALENRWLRPLGYERADVFTTACLTTARGSTGVARRLEDRYRRVAVELSAPVAELGSQPGENDIVEESLAEHAERLVAQVAAASPKVVISLGNAAACVIGALGGFGTGAALRPEDYVRDRHIRMAASRAMRAADSAAYAPGRGRCPVPP